MYVRIYFADVGALSDAELYEKIAALLPDALRQKAKRCKKKSDGYLSLGASALLFAALRDAGGSAFPPIVKDELGKPRFEGDVPFHYNLSHSGEIAMCAVSDCEVGCDVERIVKGKLRVADRYFSEAENEYVGSADDPDGAFFKIWTRKESFLKAVGCGFSVKTSDFSANVENGAAVQNATGRMRVFDVDAPVGYRAALCVEADKGEKIEITVERVDLGTYFTSAEII